MESFQHIQRKNEEASPVFIQPQLEIGKEDDEQEKEANHVWSWKTYTYFLESLNTDTMVIRNPMYYRIGTKEIADVKHVYIKQK